MSYTQLKSTLLVYFLLFGAISYSQFEVIVPDDPQFGTRFGETIDVNSNYLAVGNPTLNLGQDSINLGAVYIYERVSDSWSLMEKLLSVTDTTSTDKYRGIGYTLSLDDHRLAVGDRYWSTVYIYENDEGNWLKKYEIPLMVQDRSEFTVKMVNATLYIGISNFVNANENEGAVLIYTKEGEEWIQSDIIYPPEDMAVSDFGHILSHDGKDNMLIGSRKLDGGDGGGFLYTLEDDHWVLSRTFKDGSELEQGLLIHITEDRLAINGGEVDDFYIEIYRKHEGEWDFMQRIKHKFVYVSNIELYLPDWVHIMGRNLFITRAIGDELRWYEEIDGEYKFKHYLPKDEEDLEMVQYSSVGHSMASTDSHLFCGAVTHGITLENAGYGAVYIFPIAETSSSSQISEKEKISVSPNPSHNYLKLETSGLGEFTVESIVDRNGVVYYPVVKDGIIDISGLESGLYVLKVRHVGNEYFKSLRFIKI